MIAFLNGEWVDPQALSIPVDDAGFVLGVTVAERLRTFNGRLFSPEEHFARLRRSLEIVGVDPPESLADLQQATLELAARNYPLLSPGDDLGVTIFVTPGPYDHRPGGRPRVGIYSSLLPFQDWAELYHTGQPLQIVATRQIPDECWPAELKCRSRMHYYLADLEAQRIEPAARALLLNHREEVTEASTANLMIWRAEEGLISPPWEKILPGISAKTLIELATARGMPVVHRDLTAADVCAAEEAFLTSTSPCILPVSSINGQAIGTGQPGPIFRQLLAAWNDHVGLDLAAQATRFATR